MQYQKNSPFMEAAQANFFASSFDIFLGSRPAEAAVLRKFTSTAAHNATRLQERLNSKFGCDTERLDALDSSDELSLIPRRFRYVNIFLLRRLAFDFGLLPRHLACWSESEHQIRFAPQKNKDDVRPPRLLFFFLSPSSPSSPSSSSSSLITASFNLSAAPSTSA
jgi:hypothetical protein